MKEALGSGQDGNVWSTDRPSAIKVFLYHKLYINERSVYLRLREQNVRKIKEFNIPMLFDFDNELLIVEMELVSPPFIVDFAGASLDQMPSLISESWDEWEQARIEQFEDDWKRAKSAWWALQAHGVYLNDLHPGNVKCR